MERLKDEDCLLFGLIGSSEQSFSAIRSDDDADADRTRTSSKELARRYSSSFCSPLAVDRRPASPAGCFLRETYNCRGDKGVRFAPVKQGEKKQEVMDCRNRPQQQQTQNASAGDGATVLASSRSNHVSGPHHNNMTHSLTLQK